MARKYEVLYDEEHTQGKLHRIRALRQIVNSNSYVEGTIEAGELGGWVQSEANLSQKGECWICEDCRVYGDAVVDGGAIIVGGAEVFDEAKICDSSVVANGAKVYGNAVLFNHVLVSDGSEVYDDALITSDVRILDGSIVCGHAQIGGAAVLLDNSKISGNVNIHDAVLHGLTLSNDEEIGEGTYYANDNISTILLSAANNELNRKTNLHVDPDKEYQCIYLTMGAGKPAFVCYWGGYMLDANEIMSMQGNDKFDIAPYMSETTIIDLEGLLKANPDIIDYLK